MAITPYLCCKRAADALEFYKAAFGAAETLRWLDDAGRISHSEMQVGSSTIFVADEHPEAGILSPETIGGSPVTLVLEVADVDRTFATAIASGATELRPLKTESYGRNGKLRDPFGHEWMVFSPVDAGAKPAEQYA